MNETEKATNRVTLQIVIPTRNRPEMLEDLLKRIQGDLDQRARVVVIDDLSSPENRKSIFKLQSAYPDINFIFNEKNIGGAESRNIAARGDSTWLWFIDDDDIFPAGELRKVLERLDNNSPEERIILLSARYVNAGKHPQEKITPYGGDVNARWARYGNEVNTSCCILKRSAYEEIGGWDSTLVAGQDTDLLLRVSRVSKAIVIEDICMQINQHEGERITTNPKKQMYGKIQFLRKNWKSLHWRRSLRYFVSIVMCYPYIRKFLRV